MTVQAAAERAAAEAAEALSEVRARREFTVTKFGAHRDGYLHARVVVNGTPYYLHRRFGSWLAPGQQGGHEMLKEPEGLLGRVLGREVKLTLAAKARQFQRQRERGGDTDERDTDESEAA